MLPLAPYIPEQNGRAERIGRTIKEKARYISLGINLPLDLWLELIRAAVHIDNRIPKGNLRWKTPFGIFKTFVSLSNGILTEDIKPEYAYLKAYGYIIFAITTEARKNLSKLKRNNPKA